MTKRYLKLIALIGILAIAATACGGDDGPEQDPTGTETETGATDTGTPTGTGTGTGTETETDEPTGEDPADGGTLNLALTSDVSAAFDPQKEYYSVTWEFYRCCLLRTMMSYNARPTSQGGAEVIPDLAAEDPQVSGDGLTWTFKIKPDIQYAPPLDSVSVTAEDFIRALKREACSECAAGGYSFYYSAIEGFDAYADGKAKEITGLRAPDPLTLEVTLTQPAGDLPYRFAMAATAPIPPHPNDENAELGIAEGHDKDYGRYLVGTGPYMFEGTDALDFSAPAKDQKPVSGYQPGKSIVMVRNPSWDIATDGIRLANVEEINIEITTASPEDLAAQVDRGELDIVFDGVPPTDQLQKYLTDPELKDQVHVFESDAVRYISMNIAAPPFDDIAVRKAVNFAIDKDGLRELRGGPAFGEIAGHIIVNSLTNNLLQDYDPYGSPGGKGDLAAAKEEMKNSKYDTDGDGVCDADVCKDVVTVIDEGDPYPDQTKLIQQNLKGLGITLDVKTFERTTMYAKCNDPTAQIPFCPSPAWGKDYADAYTFGPPLFGSESIGPDACCNYSLVGAPAKVLRQNEYEVTEVPSVDAQLEECTAETDSETRIQCWADVDKELMENVVPWVPYLFDNNVDIVSENIVNYQFDQFAGLMALDQIGIADAG